LQAFGRRSLAGDNGFLPWKTRNQKPKNIQAVDSARTRELQSFVLISSQSVISIVFLRHSSVLVQDSDFLASNLKNPKNIQEVDSVQQAQ
jgi:hypothetical protein